jgi:transcriptional regulator with XRE-family HTH domain
MSQNFLKQIREAKNIGQSELAQKVGVSKQLLSGFEKGRSGVSNEVLQKLAEELGVSGDAILSGKSSNPFDEKGRKQLSKAMNMVFKFYGEEFDKETMVRIATEVYGLMIDFDALKTKSEKAEFRQLLEEKIAVGLAAKCLLKQNEPPK